MHIFNVFNKIQNLAEGVEAVWISSSIKKTLIFYG